MSAEEVVQAILASGHASSYGGGEGASKSAASGAFWSASIRPRSESISALPCEHGWCVSSSEARACVGGGSYQCQCPTIKLPLQDKQAR